MPFISADEREIAFKVVYYGPGMSGKTTNLIHLHRSLSADVRGRLVSLDTAQERTLFFDFLPLDLGRIDGFRLRFNFYTIPGQVCYEASRRLILDGADGVVFVADSQPHKRESNLQSFRSLEGNLHSYGIEPRRLPLVLQYNKRDCENPIPTGSIQEELSLNGVRVMEAIAVSGVGVMETAREVSRDIVRLFRA